MPIIVPESVCDGRLHKNLEAAGVDVLSEEEAASRDMRPARIGLLNLMPAAAMEATEAQWLGSMGSGVLQVEPVLVKFDNDRRERSGASRADLLCDYTPFSEVAGIGLDGLIVTGDNLEIEPREGIATRQPIGLKQIQYADKLNEIIDWARGNVPSTIYSCLGGHYALNYLHGLPREIGETKTFGVYAHDLVAADSPFVRKMNSSIVSPHSRWGKVSPERMAGAGALRILALNEQIGWLLAEDANDAGGYDLFVQGHPEYYKNDLDGEYQRDKNKGQALPEGYYEDDDPEKPVMHSWATDAQALHANYTKYLYERFSRPGAESS